MIIVPWLISQNGFHLMHIYMFYTLPIVFIWGSLKIFADEYPKIRKKRKFNIAVTNSISLILFIVITIHFAKFLVLLYDDILFLFLFLIELILGVIFSITFVASSIEKESV